MPEKLISFTQKYQNLNLHLHFLSLECCLESLSFVTTLIFITSMLFKFTVLPKAREFTEIFQNPKQKYFKPQQCIMLVISGL